MKTVIVGYGAMSKVLETLVDDSYIVSKETNTNFDDIDFQASVIIDFSAPAMLKDILAYATKTKTPLVIATTGYSISEIELIKEASKVIPVVYSGNYSLGVILMKRLVKEMQNVLSDFDIEITETHHNRKVDSPSGTAKMLLDALKTEDTYAVNGRNGESKRSSNEIGIHSLRGGSVVGKHSVYFYGEDEVLSITHEAGSKKIFAVGALKAAKWIIGKEANLYDMESVLF